MIISTNNLPNGYQVAMTMNEDGKFGIKVRDPEYKVVEFMDYQWMDRRTADIHFDQFVQRWENEVN